MSVHEVPCYGGLMDGATFWIGEDEHVVHFASPDPEQVHRYVFCYMARGHRPAGLHYAGLVARQLIGTAPVYHVLLARWSPQ